MTVRHFCEEGMFVREVRPRNEGPVVLFVHGLGESGLCFEHLLTAPQLEGCRLLAPDLPGYGRSPWPGSGPQGLVDQADLLAAWLKWKEAAPAVVVGHSMGAVVGLLMAERHPETVRLLVDVDGNKSPDDCVYSSQACRYDLDTFTAVGFDEMRARVHDRGIGDTALRGYYVSLRLADPGTFHRNSLELVELSGRLDLAARLAALPGPKVYIAGTPDGVSPVSRELLNAARVTVLDIDQAGHWPFIDHPRDFLVVLSEVLDWL